MDDDKEAAAFTKQDDKKVNLIEEVTEII